MNYTQANSSPSRTEFSSFQSHQFPDVLCFITTNDKTISFWKTSQVNSDIRIYIEQTTSKLLKTINRYNIICSKIILRECLSNFYHALYHTAAVIINIDEYSITFIDNGKGIANPEKAFTIGYSTTQMDDRKNIRGLGLGFSIIKKECKKQNISFKLDSSANQGTKILLTFNKKNLNKPTNKVISSRPTAKSSDIIDIPHYCLLKRQREVLALINSADMVGPSKVSKLLGIPLSTAYRDLCLLEKYGLVFTLNKKRTITTRGAELLQR